jgi:hypothetical protein
MNIFDNDDTDDDGLPIETYESFEALLVRRLMWLGLSRAQAEQEVADRWPELVDELVARADEPTLPAGLTAMPIGDMLGLLRSGELPDRITGAVCLILVGDGELVRQQAPFELIRRAVRGDVCAVDRLGAIVSRPEARY